jgi:hypothetical protein
MMSRIVIVVTGGLSRIRTNYSLVQTSVITKEWPRLRSYAVWLL